ncbi:MAG: cation:proton antiporter [Nitrosomonadales bacterium]|nr:cation:proton antiporter [Nitrosomonadales bacterium]
MPISEIVLITMGLLTVAMLAAGIERKLPIPYTVFLVIIGILMGEAARDWTALGPLLEFQLTPELVLFLLLPALIFESAFNLDARQLLKDIGPVMAMAIPALLLSTAIIGIGLWLSLGIDLVIALLFGALISATDPVAVIALFKELGAPLRLTILVEGESLLNDATAIVVFSILMGILASGTFAWSDAGGAVGEFIRVFFGGILVGTIIGIVLSELLYRMGLGVSSYIILSLILAYASFAVAEHLLHVSGVMAVIAGAITLGLLGVSRIPQSATHVVKETWEMIALVCNSLLFLMVGVSVDAAQVIGSIDVIAVAVVLVVAARAATVYSVVPAAVRLFRLPHVSLGDRHIMWWGGLKGGLAIAIVMSIPNSIAEKTLLMNLTLGVVMFSLLINAPTIRPLIKYLGIDRLTDDERAEVRHGLDQSKASANGALEHFYRTGLITGSTRTIIENRNRDIFTSEATTRTSNKDIRYLTISALRIEIEELKHLYDIGMLRYYNYLDIRNNIKLDRESWIANPEKVSSGKQPKNSNYFVRIENAILRRLRELDWAAGLLSRYQYMRFSNSLQRDIAGILLCHAVLDALDKETGYDRDVRDSVVGVYRDRLQRRQRRANLVAEEYPEFFNRFITRLLSKVSLNVADEYIQQAYQHGEVGPKAFALIERVIKAEIARIPPISEAPPKLLPSDLIGTVPLLNGLSAELLRRLADNAQSVTFMAKDIVIGEGEKGDALYLISHGHVAVYREEQPETILAELKDGDFFGEMALLGDQVRTASVRAVRPTTVLRLRHKDVMSLAEMEPELKSRLEEADKARRKADQ